MNAKQRRKARREVVRWAERKYGGKVVSVMGLAKRQDVVDFEKRTDAAWEEAFRAFDCSDVVRAASHELTTRATF